MEALTERQSKILEYIRASIRERGYPPTLREIGAHMGISSTNGVSDHLNALERKGYLRRDELKSRALRPVEEDRPAVQEEELLSVPMLGRVAAGNFTTAAEDGGTTLRFDPAMLRHTGGELFALKVQGDSMIQAGILPDDTVVVRRAQTAERGAIVVARLGEEATVKRYFPEKDYVRLKPENDQLKDLLVRRKDAAAKGFELLGVVVAVYRAVH